MHFARAWGNFLWVSKSFRFALCRQYNERWLYGFSILVLNKMWRTRYMLIQLPSCHTAIQALFLINIRPDSGSKLQFSHFTFHIHYVLCCQTALLCCVCVCASLNANEVVEVSFSLPLSHSMCIVKLVNFCCYFYGRFHFFTFNHSSSLFVTS